MSEPAGGAGSKILIVEDEEVIGQLLVDVLSQFGYRPTVVHTVAEGVAALERESFALCVSDFFLPDRTGLDFAREAHGITPELRLVLMTAYLEPSLREEVEAEPGIVEIILKPMDIFALKASVDRWTSDEQPAGLDSAR